MAQYRRDSLPLAALRHHRAHRQEWTIAIGAVPPIEGGMRVENLQSAHDQNRQTEDIDPVPDPNRQRMTVYSLCSGNRRSCHGFRYGRCFDDGRCYRIGWNGLYGFRRRLTAGLWKIYHLYRLRDLDPSS